MTTSKENFKYQFCNETLFLKKILFLSRNAVLIMKRFCRDSPAERLGYQKDGIMDIKKHKWFQGFDWDGLLDRSLAPPLLPSVQSVSDASNFDQVFFKKTSFLLFFLDISSNNIFYVRHLSSFPATRAFLLMRTLAGTKSSEKEERRYQRPVLVLAGQRRSVVCIVNLTGRGKLIKTTFVNLTLYYLWL